MTGSLDINIEKFCERFFVKLRLSKKREKKQLALASFQFPMPTIADILRKSCVANGLGASGSSSVLLARLIRGSKTPTPSRTPPKKKIIKRNVKKAKKGPAKKVASTKSAPCVASPAWSKTCATVVPKKPVPFKTAGGGKRLSAAYYFKVDCGGNIALCTPQYVRQPDGVTFKLKEIKMTTGKSGKKDVPRWFLVKP